jgi:hypothetical protein
MFSLIDGIKKSKKKTRKYDVPIMGTIREEEEKGGRTSVGNLKDKHDQDTIYTCKKLL